MAALIHGAGARPARITASTARAHGAARLLLAANGKAGELLLEPLALALGACGLLAAQNNGFKMVVTLLADIFKDRHIPRLG